MRLIREIELKSPKEVKKDKADKLKALCSKQMEKYGNDDVLFGFMCGGGNQYKAWNNLYQYLNGRSIMTDFLAKVLAESENAKLLRPYLDLLPQNLKDELNPSAKQDMKASSVPTNGFNGK